MKLLLPFLLLAMSSSASAADSADPPVVWNSPERDPFPGLVHGSFRSNAIGAEIGYNVYLPSGYAESDIRYPVIYFLHGSGGNENSDAAGFAGLVAKFIEQGTISPVICVFPNGGPRSGYRDRPETKSMVETMIVHELVPLIDRTYRTRAERKARTIVGFSMGAGGAVRFALKYPDHFSAAGAWAGAFTYRSRPENTLPADYAVAALAPLASHVRLLLIVGTNDLTLPSHTPFLANLLEAKFPFEFELLADVEHDPGAYYTHSGEKMLRFLTASF